MPLRLFLALLLSIPALAQSPESDIRAIRQQSNRAIAQHDINTFAHSLAEDFLIVRGSGVFVASKAEYVNLFREDFADPKSMSYVRTPDKIELSSAAPLAAEHGHWIGKNPDGTTGYGGPYLAMWRHTAQGWQIRSELFIGLSCGTADACKAYTQASH